MVESTSELKMLRHELAKLKRITGDERCVTPGTNYFTTVEWDFKSGLKITVVVTPPNHQRTPLWQAYNTPDHHFADKLRDAIHDAIAPVIASDAWWK